MNKTVIGLIIMILVILGAVVLLKGNKQSQTQQPVFTQLTVQPTQANETTKMANEVTVNVTSNGFEPATIKVKTGTKVIWMNKSGQTANVSSDKHPTHLLYPPLNLGSFDDGKSVSLIFDKVGSFGYHNHLDPSQTGTVVVE